MTFQDIDSKQLETIQRRFMTLSKKRLSRMLEGYSLTQSDCIKLLPLLFHVNHPMLPGYVDKLTPSGIPNFTPSRLQEKIARTVSRSFQYKSQAYLKFEIAGLYLMGSTGTLAQSIRSDLDLWVCLAELPDEADYQKLEKKTKLISQWMESKGVELNGYLVHQHQFSRKRTSDFRSNNGIRRDRTSKSQSFLLLDEFYRTAVWLCGRKPLWWLISPNDDYKAMAHRLLKSIHIRRADWIDFGNVSEIPAAEYFSAALWQLYKAIGSPYKSSLKLLILEIYTRFFTKSGLLSSHYKQLIYDGEESTTHLDPYLIVLNFAEAFLHEQPQRQEFLRRAFYLKSGVKIELKRSRKNNWRYQALKNLVERWGWDQARLDYLNSRSSWQIHSVIEERTDLVRELTQSYHFLSNFARVQGVLNEVGQSELITLGRMLYAAFEKRDGKIEIANTGIANNVAELELTITQWQDQWYLYVGLLSFSQVAHKSAVMSADSLFSVLVWAVCNQVATRQTNFYVHSQNGFYSQNFAAVIVKDLLNQYTKFPLNRTYEVYEQPSRMLQLGIYLNTENDPLVAEKASGVYSVANLKDGFSWGESRVNLYNQFSVFWLNSWGEVACKSYVGEGAWIEFFLDFRSELTTDEDHFHLFAHQLPETALHRERLFGVLRRWNHLFIESRRKRASYRFLMSIGRSFLRLDFSNQNVSYKVYRHARSLLTSLDDRLTSKLIYRLDTNLNLSPMVIKILNNTPGVYACYLIQSAKQRLELFIIDPSRTIYYQVHLGVQQDYLISHYQQFFDNVAYRLTSSLDGLFNLQYWTADLNTAQKNGRFCRVKPDFVDNYFSIQALAIRNSDGQIRFDLYVQQIAFRYRDFGELVYRQVAKAVQKKRRSGRYYPIFITDLDLSGVQQNVSVMDCLSHKRQIEQKLASALKRLAGI